MTAWIVYRDHPATYAMILLGVQFTLGALEVRMPARRDWMQPVQEKLLNLMIASVILVATYSLVLAYNSTLAEPLANFRSALHLDLWPTNWPLLAQVFLAFFLSEFLLYWIHRAEHRWSLAWRLSGHGVHHSFKRLGAINFALNHPVEILILVVPSALVELLFGAGIAAIGATVLVAVQASTVHSNLKLNTKWIGWIFTTNEFHLRHHSIVLAESNTNFGCSAIIWDRLFGTFGEGPTLETGIGPTEPSLWEKVMMPIYEPADSEIAPGSLPSA
ncbi:MAG: sterol desaturase family protein [Myxococcota bacterium]